jgi:hypothetical protein
MDGLVLLVAEDGSPLVRLASLATTEELERTDGFQREREWLQEQTLDHEVPQQMEAAVAQGMMSAGAAARLMARRQETIDARAEAVAAFADGLAAVRDAYAGAPTFEHALEQAWWDGAFDPAGGTPIRVEAGTIDDLLREAMAIALRLADGDEERAAKLMLERPRRVTGPESVAILRAATVYRLRGQLEERVRGRGLAPAADGEAP